MKITKKLNKTFLNTAKDWVTFLKGTLKLHTFNTKITNKTIYVSSTKQQKYLIIYNKVVAT